MYRLIVPVARCFFAGISPCLVLNRFAGVGMRTLMPASTSSGVMEVKGRCGPT